MLIVKDIVVEFLNKNGFDGLINDDDYCCCLTAEICDEMTGDCQPSYVYKCDDGCECDGDYDYHYHMTRTKEIDQYESNEVGIFDNAKEIK